MRDPDEARGLAPRSTAQAWSANYRLAASLPVRFHFPVINDVGMGCGASWSSTEGRRVLFLSCKQIEWDIGTFRNGVTLHDLSRNVDEGRHADRQPFDAEGQDLFCMSSGIGGTATACAGRERLVRRLS